LKGIAQELDICIILVSQFNRKIDDRLDKEPQLSDFNGASDIENIANVAIGLLRMEALEKDCVLPEDK
jgi:replicative DNA helicase